jgi:superfamily I DNA/RNA helicase
LRADVAPDSPASDAGAVRSNSVLFVSGPPGSGKTSSLALAAIEFAQHGPVAAICAHESSRAALRRALGAHASGITIDSLDGHIARWMRENAGRSGAEVELTNGGLAATRALVAIASRDVLDMSWPGFHSNDVSLDAPLLGRTEALLDQMAELFALLRRQNVEPDEFEDGCARGAQAFYGDSVENARVLCADGEVRSKASRRGRQALLIGNAALAEQKRAELGLAAVLAHCYREYRKIARHARALDDADIIDDGLSWLRADPASAHAIAAKLGGLVIDDAEDAQAGTDDLVELLVAAAPLRVAIAGWSESAIDGMRGKRAALPTTWTERKDLTAAGGPVPRELIAKRFRAEDEEADFVAGAMRDLFAQGIACDQVMVLCRDADAAAVYARELAARGLPVAAPPERWQSPHEIADLLALAAVVADRSDEAHLLRVLASPLAGLNDLSLWTLCRDPEGTAQLTLDIGLEDDRAGHARPAPPQTLSSNVFSGKADHLLSARARTALSELRQNLLRWNGAHAALAPAALIATLAAEAGFTAFWSSQPQWLRSRLHDDLRRLVAAASAWAATADEGRETAAFVRALEDGRAMPRSAQGDEGAVSCMPIVDAKGKRVPFAFVLGVAHERFPRVYIARSLAFSKKYGLIVKDSAGAGAAQTAKFAWYYAKFGAKAMYLQEEARALDYGIRRADSSAFVTGFGKAPRWAADQDLLTKYGA